MYTIVIYDASSKRDHKYQKLLSRYLHHTQNSVFEGFITNKAITELQKELRNINNLLEDSVVIYAFQNSKYIKRIEIGKSSLENSNII